MFLALLKVLVALVAIAIVSSSAEVTDCTKTPDLLECNVHWIACVNSSGVGCYNPQGEKDAGL